MSNMNDKPQRRWLGPAFLASLALNLFLVALIAVPVIKGPPDRYGPPPKGYGPAVMHGALKELPEEDRLVIRRAMRERFRDVAPHIRETREAHDKLINAIAAEPYDEAAVRAAFDDISEATLAMSVLGREAMLDGFAKLTPEQRQRVAEAMREDREKSKAIWRKHREGRNERHTEPAPAE
ncbi:MAG: periplasmic heavy metal sensor [Parvibaculum sp.]